MRFSAENVTVELPGGWAALAYRRDTAGTTGAGGQLNRPLPESTAPGATVHPVVHLASFPLPPHRGDYGSGAVDLMGPLDIFVALVEFHPEAATTALFARSEVPQPLSSDDFSPRTLQRTVPGHSGIQRFFTVSSRPFSLYVVLGSHLRRHLLIGTVNGLLGSLTIGRPP